MAFGEDLEKGDQPPRVTTYRGRAHRNDRRVSLNKTPHFPNPVSSQWTTAHSGREALENFRACEFDAVLTDRAMPEVNGDKVAEPSSGWPRARR